MSDTPSREEQVERVAARQAYLKTLGFFVSTFAIAEKSAFTLSGAVAGVTYALAQALFGGGNARVKNSLDRINNVLYVLHKQEDRCVILMLMKTDWPKISAHLGLINTSRNNILHYGYTYDDEHGPISSNEHVAFDQDQIRENIYDTKQLECMTYDLANIILIMSRITNLLFTPRDLDLISYLELSRLPWLYKPRPLHRHLKRGLISLKGRDAGGNHLGRNIRLRDHYGKMMDGIGIAFVKGIIRL